MTIKEKEVAFLKTTGEAVYVVGFRDPSPKFGDKEVLVDVRRPVAGQDGIRHVEEEFFLGELESLEDQRKRFLAEREEVLTKYGPKADKLSTPPDFGFSNN